MKKKSLLILFGFLFGLCGMFCWGTPNFHTEAASSSASVWDGETPGSENDMRPGEWSFSNGSYHINTAAALAYFARQVNTGKQTFDSQTISLETDIDLAGKSWEPIGGATNTFAGTFDGQGHYIFGLNANGATHAGLFGKIGGQAKISNLNLRNISVSSDSTYVGGLVGEVDTGSATIENCSVKGSVTSTSSAVTNVGGLAGKISGTTIEKCSADVSVSSSSFAQNTNVGGAVGFAENSTISFSNSFGDVSASGGYVGGIVGLASGSSLSNTFNVGNLDRQAQTSGKIGGLVGGGRGTFSLTNAYNAGEIRLNAGDSDSRYASGLVGYIENNSQATLPNLLMIGGIKVGEKDFDATGSQNISPLWQKDVNAQISYESKQFYFDSKIPTRDEEQKQYAVPNLCELARTRDFYRNEKYFEENSWNFSENSQSDGWRFGSENSDLPYFNFTAGSFVKDGSQDFGNNDQDASTSKDFRGQGTAQSPYLIETAGDLARLSQQVRAGALQGAYFALQNDINLTGRTWVPIGEIGTNKAFSGVFDGNGHTIFGLSCSNQNTFDCYGLFGATSNAVIKNLTVSDFSLTAGTTTGNIVGSVTGNTYLVNCVDKNTSNNSVGSVVGSLFVALGKNNKADISESGANSSLTTLRRVAGTYSTAFDVTISGEGGNFYAAKVEDAATTVENMTDALYFGEYHILLDGDGNILSQSIDTTFGKTALPGLSTNLGKTDVLIKRGSKLKGYILKDDTDNAWDVSSGWSDFASIDKQALVDGLCADWEENATQTLHVVYNAYEKANFGATKNTSASYIGANVSDKDGTAVGQDITFALGEQGEVYVDYVLEYDSFLSEASYVFDAPYYMTDKARALRGDDFKFDGLYTSINFDKEFNLSPMLVNDALETNYYAKWQGTTDTEYKTTVVFEKNDDGVELDKAVKTLEFLGYDGVKKEADILKSGNVNLSTNEFHYGTTFSDTPENFWMLNVALQDGYALAGITFDEGTFDDSAYDSNFGNPKFSGDLGNVNTLDALNELKFFNLLGNHTITITIERVKYQNRVNISDESIYFGIGPADTIKIRSASAGYSSNIEIGHSNIDKKDLTAFVSKDNSFWEALSKVENLKIAFDLVHGQIMFSSGEYDSISIDLSTFASGLYFEIDREDGGHNIYTLREDGGAITLANVSRGVDEVRFSSSGDDSMIQYRAFNSFVMIFSTEYENSQGDDKISFTTAECDNFNATSEMIDGNALKRFNDTSDDPYAQATKFMALFNDVNYQASGDEQINVVTNYVKATFDFAFVHEDDTESAIRENAPKIVWTSGNDIEAGAEGNITLYVENSDFFRLRKDTSLILYSDGSRENHPSTKETYNVMVQVDGGTLAGNEDHSDFVDGLNAVNALYFAGSSLSNKTKGVINDKVEGAKFGNNGYVITLHYNNQLLAGRYHVTFVCTDELYQVEYATRFVTQEEASDLESLVENFKGEEKENDYHEEGSLISTSVSAVGGQQNMTENFGTLNNLKFDDEISLQTSLGKNKGYVFLRWIFQSEGITDSQRMTIDIQDAFSDIYRQNENPTDQFKLYAFAVYERKQATVELADSFQIEEEHLNITNAPELGLAFNMASVTYDYGTNVSPAKATITLRGGNSVGYYLDGYVAVDAEGRELADIEATYDAEKDETATTTQITIDLEWLQTAIKGGNLLQDATNGTFGIVPILKKKTATLVFHSGTGTSSEYGDRKAGQVFSDTNNNTTLMTYEYSQNVKFGDALDLSTLVPDSESTTIENLFHHRTGYSLAPTYWNWSLGGRSVTVPLSYLQIVTSMFVGDQKTTEIHLYRCWVANEYVVTFHSNTGVFSGENQYTQLTLTLTYDETYSDMAARLTQAGIQQVKKDGYHLLRWTLLSDGGDEIFDKDGNIAESTTYFQNGKFVHDGAFDVYAQWAENQYKIQILFNKADSVVGKEAGTTQGTYSLAYNSSLGLLPIADGVQGIDAFTEGNVKRAGFTFEGVYALYADGTKTRITNDFVFNSNFPTFVLPEREEQIAVTLYFAWRFNSEEFSLSVRNSLSPLTYNGGVQDVALAKYFTEGNFEAAGFEIDATGAKLISLADNVKSIELDANKLEAGEGSNAVINSDKQSFQVKNVGLYPVILTITLSDKKISDNVLDTYFNLGDLKIIQLTFMIEVTKASIDLAEKISGDIYLENLKKLVGPFLSSENSQRLYDATSFEDACDVLESVDESVAGKADEEIYQYFMTKFYLLVHTAETNSDNIETQREIYKNWNYSKFQTFCSEQQEEFENILRRIDFFGFYDFSNTTNSLVLKGWADEAQDTKYASSVSLWADDSFAPTELKIDRLEIYSFGSSLSTGREYELRVYVSASGQNQDVLQNFELQTSFDGARYFVANDIVGYIFPQIIKLENSSKEKQTYFSNQDGDLRNVPWTMESEARDIYDRTYYLLGTLDGDKVFAHVEIQTSNKGVANSDTTYRYTSAENYLFLSDVRVYVQTGESYQDITGNFKFVLGDENEFVIKSIAGVASIRMSAAYLSKNDGAITFGGLSEDINSSVLSVSEVKYDGGSVLASGMKDGETSELEGELLFEIVTNNANQVEVFVGNAVTEVVFAVKALKLNEFISLFTWSEERTTSITGEMSLEDTFAVGKDKIDESANASEEEVAVMEFYAIFTDLVKITYEFGFPQEYAGPASQTSTLKLGEEVTSSIMPYVAGLGYASSLYVKQEDGSRPEYGMLNNYTLGGKKVFGGWKATEDAASYRFTPITLCPKWKMSSEIEHRVIMEDQKLEVFTYSSLRFSDIVWIRETNDDIFEYEYSWQIDFDDDDLPSQTLSGEQIDLLDHGGTAASGKYTLKLTRKVQDYFVQAGTFEGATEATIEIPAVHLEFMPTYKLIGIVPPENTSVTYDGEDHKADDNFVVQIRYYVFDNEINDYDVTQEQVGELKYAEDGTFEISLAGVRVTEMVNVGEYEVTLHLLGNRYALSEDLSQEDVKFVCTITPLEFDLQGLINVVTKRFNETDPLLQQNIEIKPGKVLNVQLRRDPDEDVGEKELYFADVVTENKKNVDFKFGEQFVFQNGLAVVDAPAVGKLIIGASGALQIDLTGEKLVDNKVSAAYNGLEYTLSVEDLALKINNGLVDEISLGISLYDLTKGEDLTGKPNLDILRKHMSTILATFHASDVDKAINAGTYSFSFDVTDRDFGNYYSSVTISGEYKFVINPIQITVEKLDLDKDFDGLTENIIDVAEYGDIQIKITYSSPFVNEIVPVGLDIVAKAGKDESMANNFTLDTYRAHAEIRKLKATLTLGLQGDGQDSQGGFVYGKVSESTLGNFFKVEKIESARGEEDISRLLIGQYSIKYELLKSDCTNDNGYLYVGEYAVKETGGDIGINAFFHDIEMKIKDDLKLKISQLTEEFVISSPIMTITTGDEFTSFEKVYQASTGDNLVLKLGVAGHDSGNFDEAKTYPLTILNDDYASGIQNSIKITIAPDNPGLNVVKESESVVLTIQEELLSHEYDGNIHTISVNEQEKTFTITNNAGYAQEYHILAATKDGPFSSPYTLSIRFEQEAKNAGIYQLVLEASDGENNFLFAQNYAFEITRKEIHAKDLKDAFDKDYDGMASTGQILLPGRIGEDQVFVSGRFENASAGGNKKVTLTSLSGSDANNYKFAEDEALETTSTIRKATATISLASEKFEYGTLTKGNLLAGLHVSVTSNGASVLEAYTLQISEQSITDNDYSNSFLKVKDGGYILTISAVENSASNYTFTPLTVTILVTKFQLSLDLSKLDIPAVQYGSSQWEQLGRAGGSFEYEVSPQENALPESVKVRLKALGIGEKPAVKRYDISTNKGDFESLNENYELVSVEGGEGAFEISKSKTKVYVLFDNGASDNEGKVKTSTTYDGKQYDTLILKEQADGWWLFLKNTSTEEEKALVKLAFYTLSENVYKEYSGDIVELDAQFNFRPEQTVVKNVTTNTPVYVKVDSATSSFNPVKFGLEVSNQLFDYAISVEKKQVFFKKLDESQYFTKSFTNKDAIFEYENAAEIFTGLVEGENLSATIRFEDEDGNVGRYFKTTPYNVVATLHGDTAEQYEIVYKFEKADGQDVKGAIDRAEIAIYITPKEVVYGSAITFKEGEDYYIDFGELGEFDLAAYRRQGREFNISIELVEGDKSTAGYLIVGGYKASVKLVDSDKTDFRLRYIYVGNELDIESTKADVLTITKRTLSLAEKDGQSLQDIFTRAYDGTKNAKIFGDDGALLFNIEGIMEKDGKKDDVRLKGAQYSQESGTGLPVIFQFDETSADWENYEMAQYIGAINPAKVAIEFRFGAEGVTTDVDGRMLDALAYPLAHASSLTLNAYSLDKDGFPSEISGYAGHEFLYWTLELKLSDDTAIHAHQIAAMKEQQRLGLRFEEELTAEVMTVHAIVGNDIATVRLLKEILKDNTFGLNFTNPDTKIVFVANWNAESFDLSIQIADEDGAATTKPLGRINSDDFKGEVGEDGNSMTIKDLFSFESERSVTLRAYAKEHATFEAFWLDGVKIQDGNIDGAGNFKITERDGYTELTISNVVRSLEIVARFKPQEVIVSLDVSSEDKAKLQIDGDLFDQNLTWKTDFFEVQNMTFAQLPTLKIVGKNLIAYRIGERTIEKADFPREKLVDGTLLEGAPLILTPVFETKRIAIRLNYNYAEKGTETIYVKYGETFSTAQYLDGAPAWDHVSNPTRTGYTFGGWHYLNDDNAVKGEDSVEPQDDSETLELFAKWNEEKYHVEITLENVDVVSNSNVLQPQGDNKLVAEDIPFEYSLTIEVRAKKGFHLPEAESDLWDKKFDVEIDAQGIATITFRIEAESFVATISAIGNENEITFSGENVAEVEVFNVSDDVAISVDDSEGVSKFILLSGKTVRFTISAAQGFEMSAEQKDLTFKTKDGQVLSESALRSEGIEISNFRIVENKLTFEISGITIDLQVVFKTKERENLIKIDFDNFSTIAFVTVGQTEHRNPAEPISATAKTGEEISLIVGFAHGYDFDHFDISDLFDPTQIEVETRPLSDGRYGFTLRNISSDAAIKIYAKAHQYTITLKVTSYAKQDDEQDGEPGKVDVPGNTVTITFEGEEVTTLKVDFGTKVTLNLNYAKGYDLVGWNIVDGGIGSKDVPGFEEVDGKWTYLVTDDITIWAVFSEIDNVYDITLKMMDYAKLDGNWSNVQEQFIEIDCQFFEDALLEHEIPQIEKLQYGGSKTIWFKLPQGYDFSGFGFFEEDGTFQPLSTDVTTEEIIKIEINTTLFGRAQVSEICFLVTSRPITMHVESKVSYNGQLEDKFDVGGVELSDAEGQSANALGYIDGSRVHYLPDYFENGSPTSFFAFDFVAYTQIPGYHRDDVFLKIFAPRAGYVFDSISISNEDVSCPIVLETEDFVIARLSGLRGGMGEISITILYAPKLNIVDFEFVHDGHQTDGGLIEIESEQGEIRKLWTSGNRYSSVTVSAFTDVEFSVAVYIGAGFVLDEDFASCVDDPNHIIKAGTLRYDMLSVEEDGFSGVLRFDVIGFLGLNQIHITVKDRKYVVVFKDATTSDETIVLAKIHDVGFDTSLQAALSIENSQNIETFGIQFADGWLDLVRALKDHHFEGYFTYQNGAGKRYVDSDGRALGNWMETGLEYNGLTGKYELQKNASINENQEIEISLYLYMSYYKTRISVEFVPSININFTAQDIITGVDATNSWFYLTNPNYIEVSFNTDINFFAPEINGYKFYQFVINQRTFDGDWLTPVVFYQNRMPWSTNEVDRIVECRIEIVYFAQLDVRIVGGEGDVQLAPASPEDYVDEQSQALLKEHYFDTSKGFKLTPSPAQGYTFVRWEYQGVTRSDPEIEISSSRQLVIYMYLRGDNVTLNFRDYDPTLGQIVRLTIVSKSGTQRNVNDMMKYDGLGRYVKNPDRYNVQASVGDVVTFVVSMANDISVVWKDMPNIVFKQYNGGLSYFEMTILGEDANEILRIIPEFSNARRMIYVSSAFASDEIFERALDANDATFALQAFVDGEENYAFGVESGHDVEIELLLKPRYDIKNISVRSVGSILTDLSLFFQDGKIVLSNDLMDECGFGGNVYIQIEISRIMWQDTQPEAPIFKGAGTSKNPYHITNTEELLMFMQLVNSGAVDVRGQAYREGNYVLDADLSIDEKFWTPIGTTQFEFDGSFNFNNHTISGINLAILYDQISYNGLFGVLGANANISRGATSWWWILLIVLLVLLLVVLFVALVYHNKKKKKEREELAKK